MKKIFTILFFTILCQTNIFATVDYFLKAVAINGNNYTGNTNIGSFAPNAITLQGAGGSTYQNGGDDVCTPFVDYTVSGGGPTGTINMVYAGAGPGSGDKVWANPAANVNISALANGTYTLTCNYRITGKGGGVTCFGSGNDFTTGTLQTIVITFTINSALPISLSSFDGKKVNNQNQLSWTTETEKNGSLFEVEKSVNGKSWAKLGEVAAKGNTTRRENYSFTDKNPAATNYYRLKMVDRDGSYEYSKIVSANNGKSTVVNLFPNPVQERLNLNIESQDINEVNVQVINMNGQVVLVSNNTIGRSNTPISIDANELQSGIYFVKITDENANVIGKEKFLKQ